MIQKAILFDLDGTLTDSGEGIMNCATLALEHYGLPVPDRETMREIVGPPLRDSFIKYGIPAEEVENAIAIFRGRYTTIGKYENRPYKGIVEMLAALKAQGHKLYIATSKPEPQAKDILAHFDLIKFFDLVAGASADESRATKEEVIEYLKSMAGEVAQPVMIGDTVYDVKGAAVHGIPAIGVSWGYGNVADMVAAGAKAIADTPEQLMELINA